MTSKERYIDNIRKRIGRTIQKHEMLSPEEHILIALSGGKDSLILLDVLADRKKYIPFDYTISAIHIDIENIPYETDIKFLQKYCGQRDVKFQLHSSKVEFDEAMIEKKGYCYLCASNRRKEIFKYAQQQNCKKLAFGHHMDDALQTLLMNMMYHGSISSMPQKLEMFEGSITIIRPLLEMTEDELIKYADIQNFPKEIKRCPFGENTKRIYAREMINNLQKDNKNAKKNMFRAMDNIYHEYLPKKK